MPRRYLESLKRQVCNEFVKGEKITTAILNQYGIRFIGALPYWLRELGLDRSPKKPVLMRMKKKGDKADQPTPRPATDGNIAELLARNKDLERRLEDNVTRPGTCKQI